MWVSVEEQNILSAHCSFYSNLLSTVFCTFYSVQENIYNSISKFSIIWKLKKKKHWIQKQLKKDFKLEFCIYKQL